MEHTENFDKQSLTEHLTELRSCLIYSLIAVGAGFLLAYSFIQPIGEWFFQPLLASLPESTSNVFEGNSLIFTSYQEGFFFI